MTEIPGYFKYWGKAGKETEPGKVPWHPLVYHSIDVAAVGWALLKMRPRLLSQIAKMADIEEDILLQFIPFLLSLHDIGKFPDCFQRKHPELFTLLRGNGPRRPSPDEHHTFAGYLYCIEKLATLIGGKKICRCDKWVLKYHLDHWINPLTGHHGVPPKQENFQPEFKTFFHNNIEEDSLEFLLKMIEIFLDKEIYFAEHALLPQMSWLLAGLTVTADWIASDERNFPYWETEKPFISLEDYWNRAVGHAMDVIKDIRLAAPQVSIYSGISGIFPRIIIPTPLQRLVHEIDIPENPHLFIIEEVTGGGKTEAAVILAHRLMDKGLADGIFLGMPTMATANAMYGRILRVYESLFAGGDASFILAHSAARMILQMETDNPPTKTRPNEEVDSVHESYSWLSDSRKKALLADIGVGTIDQALLGILPVRHQSLRLLGLSCKVLIVDEVHACDEYMAELLSVLLQFHAAFGGSAILLSATLPQAARNNLIKAYGGSGDAVNSSYPLLTSISGGTIHERSFSARDEMKRTVKIRHLSSIDDVNNGIQEAIDAGKCVCWVRNTVDDPIEAYKEWVERVGSDKVTLFHARFALGDRLGIESEVKRLFGPDSTVSERRGRLLIASPVIQESLDVDFDYMVTDLAPIDLIIQRAGRLRRHMRDKEGNPGVGTDLRGEIILGVFMPIAAPDAGKDWYEGLFKKAAGVYRHHGRLWLTAKWLQEKGAFTLPADARDMIESVYGDEGMDSLPAQLAKIELKQSGEDSARKQLAAYRKLNLDEGYVFTGGNWEDDENGRTRLDDGTVTVRLVQMFEDGSFKPWISGRGHDWELSQLSVGRYRIREGIPVPEPQQSAIKKEMRAELNHYVIICLGLNGGRWTGSAIGGKGSQITVEYDNRIGLVTLEETP